MNCPEDLLRFVSNVEGYPVFINLLSAVRVTNRRRVGDLETFEAEVTVSYKFFSEKFRSFIRIDHAKNEIDVSRASRRGAVRFLKNRWVFHELSDGSSLVDFSVDVRLKALPLEMILRRKFYKAAVHMIGLFETRARQVYPEVGDSDLDLKAEYKRLNLREPAA
ncbi:MAG: hypothetical protein GDA39_06275 [Hyphomonadaceae bacterium]|nr:hypothetical protein [Hyphomonadaceae bacterium]MBC6412504.1 hypothetical protein [Hyphomonadaceae bacterium]